MLLARRTLLTRPDVVPGGSVVTKESIARHDLMQMQCATLIIEATGEPGTVDVIVTRTVVVQKSANSVSAGTVLLLSL